MSNSCKKKQKIQKEKNVFGLVAKVNKFSQKVAEHWDRYFDSFVDF